MRMILRLILIFLVLTNVPVDMRAIAEPTPVSAAKPLSEFATSSSDNVIETQDGEVDISVVRGETTLAEFPKVLNQAADQNRDLLVSTDSSEVSDEVAAKVLAEKSNATGLRRLIPLGQLAKRTKDHVIKSILSNKIGFAVVTITTFYDCYVWVHATEHSPEVRAMESIFSILMTLAFSIDRDTWPNLAHHINNKILHVFDSTNSMTQKARKQAYYATNIAMNLISQGLRFSILAVDQWGQPNFIRNTLIGIGVLAAASTFTSVGWAEFSRRIDLERYPFAKSIVKMASTVRSILMGRFAPNSMLMHPSTFGYAPWFTASIAAVIGYFADKYSDNIASWLESGRPIITNIRQRFLKWAKGVDKTLAEIEGPDRREFEAQRECSELLNPNAPVDSSSDGG